MSKVLVFDFWAPYGHFKKIYATTSALTYPIPFKTTIYGIASAIMGLDKFDNAYLSNFTPGACKVGIQVLNEPKTQRLHTNLSIEPGMIKKNRKPTLLELLKSPRYRIFWTHQDGVLFEKFKTHLEEHTSVYTPSMGLAGLLANFEFVGTFSYQDCPTGKHLMYGAIPVSAIESLDIPNTIANENEIVEVGMYALEMDTDRNVTKRDNILFDRKNKPVSLQTAHAVTLDNYLETNFKITLF